MESWILTTVNKHFLPVTFKLSQLLFISDSTSFCNVRASNFDHSCKSHSQAKKKKNRTISCDCGLVGCDTVDPGTRANISAGPTASIFVWRVRIMFVSLRVS